MPSSTARATARSRSAGVPRIINPPTLPQPKPSAEIVSPVRPRILCSMAGVEYPNEAIRELPGLLPLLSVRAREPDQPAAALRRHVDVARLRARGRRRGPAVAGAAGAGDRLRLRLGRTLQIREEPAGHVHVSDLQLHGRLGDVAGHPHPSYAFLGDRDSNTGSNPVGATTLISQAVVPREF